MQKTEWRDPRIGISRTDDAGAIRNLGAAWVQAEHDRDLGALLRMVTDDVVFLRPGAAPIEGRQALEDLYRFVWASMSFRHRMRFREVRINGDVGYTVSDEDLTFTPLGDGSDFRLRGSGMAVILRGQDGRWRFSRAITNILPERR